jgi:hypothetical protein
MAMIVTHLADELAVVIVCNHADSPKKRLTFVTPSYGLFLTCRVEKYTASYRNYNT